MVILFFISLILAWPTAGLSIVAYIILFFVRAALKARAEASHSGGAGFNPPRQKEKELNVLDVIGEALTGKNSMPSWINDERSLDQFIFDLRVMAAKRGIPKAYVFEYMRDEVTGQSILHYMSVLERKGDHPIHQKREAAQALKRDWDKLDSSQQSRYLESTASTSQS